MQKSDIVERPYLKEDVPDFRPGDTVKINIRVIEKSLKKARGKKVEELKERRQAFQGVVIRRRGAGTKETFTVRKISYGVGVERTFPLHSPNIFSIEVIKKGKVRRSKLYYLRDRVGKSARIKEAGSYARKADTGKKDGS